MPTNLPLELSKEELIALRDQRWREIREFFQLCNRILSDAEVETCRALAEEIYNTYFSGKQSFAIACVTAVALEDLVKRERDAGLMLEEFKEGRLAN